MRPKIKPRFNKPMPPPMSFETLMNMAAQGKPLPSMGGGTVPAVKKNDNPKKKAVRPMTASEKESYERRQSKEYRNYLKFGGKRPEIKKEVSSSDSSDSSDSDDRSNSKSSVSTVTSTSISSKTMVNGKEVNISRPPGLTTKPSSVIPKGGYSQSPKTPGMSKMNNKTEQSSSKSSSSTSSAKHSHKSDTSKTKFKEEPGMSTWDRIYGQVHKPKKGSIIYTFLFLESYAFNFY